MEDLPIKLKKKKILIYGYGRSGKTCFSYLKKNNFVNVYDDFTYNLSVKKKFVLSKKKIIKSNFDFIVISPGININKCGLNLYLKKNLNKIITDLDIFYLENPKTKNITITGTNGKSTTSKLLYEVLKKNKKDVRLAGNIGRPILGEKKIKKNTYFVIEASSYQIEYSKFFKSKYAAILNIAPDHLERHGNFSNYVKAKLKLLINQKKNDVGFIENKNKYIKKQLKSKKINSILIKVKNNISRKIKKKISNNYFKNLNNEKNLAFVIEISKKLKIKINNVIKSANSFKGLNYRQQILFSNRKLLIINDSKSTSFSSSENLLKSYKNIYWLLGGLSKKGDRLNLKNKYFKNIKAYIFGKSKNFFISKLKGKIKYKIYSNIKEALNGIFLDSKNDHGYPKNIIFSPSAASFDQFNDFEHRGKYFNEIIKKSKFIEKFNGK